MGFVLAAAGSAVGLGNIWMFPYRAGSNGGAAFVLVYVAAVLFVGMPLMASEIMLGRMTRRNPVGAFRVLRPGSSWPTLGWLGVGAGFVILSYYGVVAGWALDYAWTSLNGSLAALGQAEFREAFEALVSDGRRQIFWQAVFMVVTMLVVSRGVEHGIERAGKVLMPMLFALVLVLLGYSLSSDGAEEGLAFFLKPSFSELGWRGALAALGQAFFSLSLGMGAMITYGSYLESHESLPRSVAMISVLDTGVAILAGLVIFPLVFTFGLEPSAGPGLVFITLPKAFAMMPASSFLAATFFLLLIFAALTSAISLLEVVVAFLVDEFGVARGTAAFSSGTLIFVLGIPSAVIPGFLDRVDALATYWMLPIGGLFIAAFSGWSLQGSEALGAYGSGASSAVGYELWRFCVRFLAPLAVATILLQNSGLF